jgi:hypothetical protein
MGNRQANIFQKTKKSGLLVALSVAIIINPFACVAQDFHTNSLELPEHFDYQDLEMYEEAFREFEYDLEKDSLKECVIIGKLTKPFKKWFKRKVYNLCMNLAKFGQAQQFGVEHTCHSLAHFILKAKRYIKIDEKQIFKDLDKKASIEHFESIAFFRNRIALYMSHPKLEPLKEGGFEKSLKKTCGVQDKPRQEEHDLKFKLCWGGANIVVGTALTYFPVTRWLGAFMVGYGTNMILGEAEREAENLWKNGGMGSGGMAQYQPT